MIGYQNACDIGPCPRVNTFGGFSVPIQKQFRHILIRFLRHFGTFVNRIPHCVENYDGTGYRPVGNVFGHGFYKGNFYTRPVRHVRLGSVLLRRRNLGNARFKGIGCNMIIGYYRDVAACPELKGSSAPFLDKQCIGQYFRRLVQIQKPVRLIDHGIEKFRRRMVRIVQGVYKTKIVVFGIARFVC